MEQISTLSANNLMSKNNIRLILNLLKVRFYFWLGESECVTMSETLNRYSTKRD